MFFALSLGFAGLFYLTDFARAHTAPQCAERLRVVEILGGKYGETRVGIGLASNASVMELYASSETGSWTVTMTTPDGMTCLMVSGQGFEALAEKMQAMGDPA